MNKLILLATIFFVGGAGLTGYASYYKGYYSTYGISLPDWIGTLNIVGYILLGIMIILLAVYKAQSLKK